MIAIPENFCAAARTFISPHFCPFYVQHFSIAVLRELLLQVLVLLFRWTCTVEKQLYFFLCSLLLIHSVFYFKISILMRGFLGLPDGGGVIKMLCTKANFTRKHDDNDDNDDDYHYDYEA